MKHHFDLKIGIFFFTCFMVGGMAGWAQEPNSFAEMPKSCQNIQLEKLTFELPLSIQNLSLEQQKQIRIILDDARTQACILQMQYDGLMQQVIAILFENAHVSAEQLKPFYDQLVSLMQNRVENKVKTILSIQKILTPKEWQALIVRYEHFIKVKNDFLKQQEALKQTYNMLISGNNMRETGTVSLMSPFICIENNSKINILKQIGVKLSLTNTQEEHFYKILQKQGIESCVVRRDMNDASEQLLKMPLISMDQAQEKQYKSLFSQLVTKEYVLETYQIEALSSLFQILTPKQKMQLKEQYMIIKGIL